MNCTVVHTEYQLNYSTQKIEMTYYEDAWRCSSYRELTDGDDYTYKYLKVDNIHNTTISSVWIAEREVPNSETAELCVAKEIADGVIDGENLIRSSGVSVKLKDYLRQMKLVNHDNLVKFYGYDKTQPRDDKYRLMLICEYCPGTVYAS